MLTVLLGFLGQSAGYLVGHRSFHYFVGIANAINGANIDI
jgi:hypothetical protein